MNGIAGIINIGAISSGDKPSNNSAIYSILIDTVSCPIRVIAQALKSKINPARIAGAMINIFLCSNISRCNRAWNCRR